MQRAGELTAIRVSAEAEEAVRDLVRARAALLADRKRAQQRITAMLMRHGRIWRAASWTQAHERWIAGQRFDEPALAAAFAHYRTALDTRLAELGAVEAELAPWAGRQPLGPLVARLGCYRGIAELTGLTLAAEVADWRRFPSARAFMGFTGLVPAEYSSGERVRRRCGLAAASNRPAGQVGSACAPARGARRAAAPSVFPGAACLGTVIPALQLRPGMAGT